MKGYESTKENREHWQKEGYIAVACRLCGELMLFSKDYYTEQDLIGYECPYHALNISLFKEELET